MGNSLAVPGDVFDSVFFFFLLFFFPLGVFDEIWDLIESVSEGFPNYLFFKIYISILSAPLNLKIRPTN